ncbi:hypothetical protein [Chryseobacterium sp. Mn2064]|uniref:hypothetical protein n=1 Tax=Chryseobacterium sp. Mn2064 TaxID=3395263 RepID=UPI003BBFCCEB
MKKEFQINEPCHVGRENMQDIPDGSFCSLCSKKVHNLSDKTDEEIHSLIEASGSICGRIQVDRLYVPQEESQTLYHFFQLPFRKIASGIFLSLLFTSNLNAQRKEKDTMRTFEIEGFVTVVPKTDDEHRSRRDYFKPPIIRTFKFQTSGNTEIKNQHKLTSILTPKKRYYFSGNSFSMQSDEIRVKNIFVIQDFHKENAGINENQYFLFVYSRQMDEDKILNLNLDKAKKLPFNPKAEEFLYILDGKEISKEDYELYRQQGKIDSYFLPELYAKELFGEEFDLENGAIVSYLK